MRWLIPVLLTLSLPACFVGRFSVNEPLRFDTLKRLEPGKTTALDAVAILGAPSDVVQLGKRSAYLYVHSQEKNAGLLLLIVGVFNEDTRSDRVWLFFDENQILSHVGSTLASHRASYALPWFDLHDPEEMREDDADRLQDEQSGGS